MSAYLTASPYNIPLAAVIANYVLAFVPHAYATHIGSGGNMATHNNVAPASSAYHEKVKKRLGPKTFAAWERARAAHRNALENMPIFIAAIFAGYLAEERLKAPGYGGLTAEAAAGQVGVTTFALGWLALRTFYTVNYIVVETQGWSFLRSISYIAGVGWAFTILGRAAKVLA